jgi:hemoglobin-like flavoprotein
MLNIKNIDFYTFSHMNMLITADYALSDILSARVILDWMAHYLQVANLLVEESNQLRSFNSIHLKKIKVQ